MTRNRSSQRRLAARADEQRRLPPFCVDEVDGQCPGTSLCGDLRTADSQNGNGQTTGDATSAHVRLLPRRASHAVLLVQLPGPRLVDIVAAVFSVLVMVVFLKVWRPPVVMPIDLVGLIVLAYAYVFPSLIP